MLCRKGNNYAFLSCYESPGWVFKAGAARRQSSRVTTAPTSVPGNFFFFFLFLPPWNMASWLTDVVCAPFYAMLYFSHAHEHSINREVCCGTLIRPWIWNTISYNFSFFSPWDAFTLVFSPQKFFPQRGFFRGVFFRGYVATYPK